MSQFRMSDGGLVSSKSGNDNTDFVKGLLGKSCQGLGPLGQCDV